MKKGEIEARYFDGVSVVKWIDVKPVMMMSTIDSGNKKKNTTIVKRRQKSKAEKVKVTVPAIVDRYNKHMIGADLFDQKTTVNTINRKSPEKYYCRLFWDYIDMSLVNEHIIYKKLINKLPSSNSDGAKVAKTQKDFRRFVALKLIGSFSSRKKNLSSTRRYRDPLIQRHHTEYAQKQGRCKRCYENHRQDRKVFIRSVDCQVFPCLNKNRNFWKTIIVASKHVHTILW